MTFYFDPADAGHVQGIWHYRPGLDDWPNYLCDRANAAGVSRPWGGLRRWCSWRARRG
jgi:hypothetical protein